MDGAPHPAFSTRLAGLPAGGAVAVARRAAPRGPHRRLPDDLRLRLLGAAAGDRSVAGGADPPGTEVYIAEAAGVGRYDPAARQVVRVLDADIRDLTSSAPAAAAAVAILIYVSAPEPPATGGRSPGTGEATATDALRAAFAQTAAMARGVYRFCAAEALGTCLVAGSEAAALAGVLGLPASRRITCVQPVGYPPT